MPWALYRRYGDTRVLQANYDAMKRWIAYLQANSNNLIRPNQGYGDWLAPDSSTPLDLIGTAFFAHSTDIVRRAAVVLGHDEDAATYASLYSQIKSAFVARWVRADGTVGSGSQTSYVLALKFGLVPDALKAAAFDRLVADVTGRGNHLSTGFLGTPFLLSVLQDGGRGDVAHKLLAQDSYPSWGYMLARGGTTIWERWDGIRPDGSLQDAGMNSFNHYGLGSIGDWLYDSVGGLAPDESAPGLPPDGGRPVDGCGAEQRLVRGPDGLRARGDRVVARRRRPASDRRRRTGEHARRGARAARRRPAGARGRQARGRAARRDVQGHDQRRRGLRGRLRELPLPGRGRRRRQRERRRLGDGPGDARARPRRPRRNWARCSPA